MSETSQCSECGAQLPTGATEGLCPKCLMGAALGSDSADEKPSSAPFAATTPMTGGFVPPEAASLAEHFPQLEILELIGHGGMGAVYKARQTKLDRLVALKIIRPESAEDPTFAERFNREARTLARLSHPHIVAVHDFGEVGPVGEVGSVCRTGPERENDADAEDPAWQAGSTGPDAVDAEGSARQARPTYFFIMEHVDGANLRELIESRQLGPEQALAIVPQICDALQYAHDEGVIHRDIKPENILLDHRGRVKIADFGLAKLAAQSAEDFTLTATHQVMGTPRYMAPEQMEGSHTVDHRADIYSLGVVFYEMLTGEVPMGSFAPPSQKAEIDARLDQVVLRALAREPERRYQQAGEIRSDVESIVFASAPVGESGVSQPSGPYAPTVLTPPPGPSTVLEQGVAAAVARFRGIGSRQPQPPAGDAPRFSRKAIVGAIWAALFFLTLGIALSATTLVQEDREAVRGERARENLQELGQAIQKVHNEEPLADVGNTSPAEPLAAVEQTHFSTLAVLLLGLIVLPGALAPFGTTILGMMAVSDIRQSNGKLTGLGLAFADAVLFPVLLLFGLIFSFALWESDTTGINHPDFKGSIMASAMVWLVIVIFLLTWLWRAVTSSMQLDERSSKSVGGRDWITLTRDDVEHDRLPAVCMICGAPAHDRVNKTFHYEPEWDWENEEWEDRDLAKRMRVACPVCRRHRGHWRRQVLVASTGWLLVIVVSVVGYAIGEDLVGFHGAVGAGTAGIAAFVLWIGTIIYLANTRVYAEEITDDDIKFQRVAAGFVKAAADIEVRPRPTPVPQRRSAHDSGPHTDREQAVNPATPPVVAPELGQAKPQADSSPSAGGRDWVTLSRDDVEHDRLPNVCMVCGTPTGERVSKTFEYQPGWASALTAAGIFLGIIPGLIIAALTSTQVRVACPVCPEHRGHWRRLVWVASTGWLLAFIFAGVGYLIGQALYPEHGGPQAVGAVIGAVVGLIAYLVPVIYLASTRVSVESMTKDDIRFHRVSAAFARASAGQQVATGTSQHRHRQPIPGGGWHRPSFLLVACIAVIAIAAIGALIVTSWDSFDDSTGATLAEPPPRSIAVLRFVSVGDPRGGPLQFFPHAQLTEEFCDDLTDAVRRQITETANGPLLVRPIGNKYGYFVTDDESLRAGRTLNVRTVVKATLHCVDADGNLVPQDLDGTGHVVLTVKMLDVSTGALLWVAELKEPTPTNEEERRTFQERIAEAVAEQVERKLPDDRA